MRSMPKNCPECDSRRLQIISLEIEPYRFVYQIRCLACGMAGGQLGTTEAAVVDWNVWADYWTRHKFDIEIEEI